MIHFAPSNKMRIYCLLTLVVFRVPTANSSGAGTCDERNDSMTCNYIPGRVPKEINRVIIKDFVPDDVPLVITAVDFQPEAWSHVKYLELSEESDDEHVTLNFTSACFKNLKQLEELHIHITRLFSLDPDAFLGLDNVKTLDVSLCGRLTLENLVAAVNDSNKLPILESVNISRTSYRLSGLTLSYDIFASVINRNIKRYDIVNTQINMIRPYFLSLMKALEIVNLSSSSISDISNNIPVVEDLVHIKSMDLSNVEPPKTTFIIPKNIQFRFEYKGWPNANLLIAPRSVNLSEVILNLTPGPSTTPIQFRNCFLNLTTALNCHVNELILQQNFMNYVDVEVHCKNTKVSSITILDLSGNGLEFLHPSILSCVPNLEVLNLFNNKLQRMSSGTSWRFEMLLKDLQRLQKINLSTNELSSIPVNFFIFNHALEIIDLSHNQLDQVTFTLIQATKLRQLFLHGNQIKILDSYSIRNLETLSNNLFNRSDTKSGARNISLDFSDSTTSASNISIATEETLHTFAVPTSSSVDITSPHIGVSGTNKTNSSKKVTVTLYDNPLSCSECRAKNFLHWLLTTHTVGISGQKLMCKSEQNTVVILTEERLKDIDDICERKIIIITGCTSVVAVVLLLATMTVFIFRRRRLLRKMNNRQNIINLLQRGEDKYEFAVFLSYSSADEIFVTNNVFDQLQETLSKATNIQRNVVCVGDMNLRPGFAVLEETIRCMNRSALVIIVLSDNYCESDYCLTEMEQAYHLKKSIVQIVKGTVNETNMTPIMKLLFRKNVRILFTEINGEYELKNTWENICKSLLDLIAGNLR